MKAAVAYILNIMLFFKNIKQRVPCFMRKLAIPCQDLCSTRPNAHVTFASVRQMSLVSCTICMYTADWVLLVKNNIDIFVSINFNLLQFI
jgi:hypothetical protein